MKSFALLALLLTFAALPATAQTMDPRVTILKGQLEGFLENQKAMAVKNGCKMVTKGSVTVEKAGAYYAFTTPAITYTDSEGVRSEIGMIALNAAPQANNEWKVSMSLPTPVTSYNKNGGEQFRTDIGTQNATGIWNERLGHFTSVNANLGNVQFNDLITQNTTTVGALTLSSALTEKDADAYTGSARATLDNVSLFNANTQVKSILPKIVLDTNLADRASKTAMTKEQVKNRPQSSYPDFFNVFSQMFGTPELVKAKVTGLDAVNGQLQQSVMTAKPEERARLLQSILAVGAVSGMGRPVPGDAQTKSYDILFGQNGSVTVNGTDFGSLMNGVAKQR